MFVDASAIVAILMREPEGRALAATLDEASAPVTSAVAVYEAVMAICRKKQGSIAQAREDVAVFLNASQVTIVSIAQRDGDVALEAAARYGKGRGHPAQLNMGDCFAYAVAITHGKALLFKGDDFSKTDIPPAM